MNQSCLPDTNSNTNTNMTNTAYTQKGNLMVVNKATISRGIPTPIAAKQTKQTGMQNNTVVTVEEEEPHVTLEDNQVQEMYQVVPHKENKENATQDNLHVIESDINTRETSINYANIQNMLNSTEMLNSQDSSLILQQFS